MVFNAYLWFGAVLEREIYLGRIAFVPYKQLAIFIEHYNLKRFVYAEIKGPSGMTTQSQSFVAFITRKTSIINIKQLVGIIYD